MTFSEICLILLIFAIDGNTIQLFYNIKLGFCIKIINFNILKILLEYIQHIYSKLLNIK